MKCVLFVLLLSGTVTSYLRNYREYHFVNTAKSWLDAQDYCKVKYDDLATFGNSEDAERVREKTVASGFSGSFWIGLMKSKTKRWQWSMGESQYHEGTAKYTNWITSEPGSSLCGAFYDHGGWAVKTCSLAHHFACIDEKKASREKYVLVLKQNTWRDSQKYCRKYHTDLAIVRNQEENQALHQSLNDTLPSRNWVWMGLFSDGWHWSDKSGTSFRSWDPTEPNSGGKCGLLHAPALRWWDRKCTNKYPFYCQKVIPMAIRVVRVELTPHSPLNLSDAAVQEALLQQIKEKVKARDVAQGVSLRWGVQPDGEVFYNKQAEKTTTGC